MREQGIVKMFDPQKGFGFIRRGGAGDVFFHVNQMGDTIGADDIEVGAAVEFEVVADRKDSARFRAINLTLQGGN